MKPYIKIAINASIIIVIIFLFKEIPSWSKFYALHLYPLIKTGLNGVSSVFPFSLYDLFIITAVGGILIGIVLLFITKFRKRAFYTLLAGGLSIYIAFYVLWGINYYAPGFMERNRLEPLPYDSIQFRTFLSEYSDTLNASYTNVPGYTSAQLDSLIRKSEEAIHSDWNFPTLPKTATVKPMLFGRAYAAMGIRGYYGPFFAEAHINPLYLPHEKAAVTAHELAHLAGITSEAEANLYAYLITTRSEDAGLRFSGYYSLLPYVLGNAYQNLSEEEYMRFVETIDPRIRQLYRESRSYWQSLYSEDLGKIQDYLYEAYLKGNNIPSGQANYSEVIRLILAIRFSNTPEK